MRRAIRSAGGHPIVNLVIVHTVYGLGFTTLFFRNEYEAVPTELVKAAMVEGAGLFQIFRRVILPNSTSSVSVIVIYQFTNIWNDSRFGSTFAAGESWPPPSSPRGRPCSSMSSPAALARRAAAGERRSDGRVVD